MAQTKKPYRDRLRISLHGDDLTIFKTRAGTVVAIGYERVVIGDRGPYVEFSGSHIQRDALWVPEDQGWRHFPGNTYGYYKEWRSKDWSNVMVYQQTKTVDYADYRVGMWYISPVMLHVGGLRAIGGELFPNRKQLKLPGLDS